MSAYRAMARATSSAEQSPRLPSARPRESVSAARQRSAEGSLALAVATRMSRIAQSRGARAANEEGIDSRGHATPGAVRPGTSRRTGGGDEVPTIVHEVLRSSGTPLDAKTRDEMQARLGADLGHVRVHSDARAAESARAVDALAYTVGSSIVFDRARYAPREPAGRALLIHELVHTVQQGNRGIPSASGPLRTESHNSAGEREARMIAATLGPLGSRASANVTVAMRVGSGVIQRQDPKDPPDWQPPMEPDKADPHVWEMPETPRPPFPGTPKPDKHPPSPHRIPGLRDQIADALRRQGIPAWAVSAMVTLIVAALADPEPFSKVALLIGSAAAAALLIALGRRPSNAPPEA